MRQDTKENRGRKGHNHSSKQEKTKIEAYKNKLSTVIPLLLFTYIKVRYAAPRSKLAVIISAFNNQFKQIHKLNIPNSPNFRTVANFFCHPAHRSPYNSY